MASLAYLRRQLRKMDAELSGSKRLLSDQKATKRQNGFSLQPIYYVYALIDPRDDVPFYIGKGKGKRHDYHVHEWKKGETTGNQRKLTRIAEIHAASLTVKVEIITDGLTEAAAYKLERSKIFEHRPTLTNLFSGTRSDAERAYERVEYLMTRTRTPMQWARAFARRENRIPKADDWKLYLEVVRGHQTLLNDLRKIMMVEDAQKANNTTDTAA